MVLQLARPADRPGRRRRSRPCCPTRWRPRTSATRWSSSSRAAIRGGTTRRSCTCMPHAGGWGGFEGGDGEDGLINNVNGGVQGLPGRGLRDEVPGADPRLRLPPRHRRAGPLPRRLRHLPHARARAPTRDIYLWFERSVTPGWGLFGGRDAVGPDVVVNPRAAGRAAPAEGERAPARRRRRSCELAPAAAAASGTRSSATRSASARTCSTAT